MIAQSPAGYFWHADTGGPVINLCHVVSVDRQGSGPCDSQGRAPLRVITTVPGVTYTISAAVGQEFLNALTGGTHKADP